MNTELVERPPQPIVAEYGAGDTKGKSLAAMYDAADQIPLQEAGSVRQKLYQMQAMLAGYDEVECPLQHVFAPGAYARTIFIPAGTIIIGKIHKHQHLNVLSQGEVTVLTEGGGLQRIKGPLTMSSLPGTKRAVYAHTDVVWTTIHLTDKTDLAEIEKEIIAANFEEYEQFIEQQKLLEDKS